MPDDGTGPEFSGPILLAHDFAVTLGFYRSIGFSFEGEEPYAKWMGGPCQFSIASGPWWVQVNGPENPFQGESAVSNTVLRIQVDSVDEWFGRLLAQGVRFLTPPTERLPMGVRNAFLRDPDDRIVMLTSPAP